MSLTTASIAPTGDPTSGTVVAAIEELHEGIEERLTLINSNLVDDEGVAAQLTDAVKELTLWVRMLGNGEAGTTWGGMEALGKAVLDSGERVATSIDEHTSVLQQLLDKLK